MVKLAKKMKKILIFGATGSIGTQAIELISNNPQLKLVGISYHNNESLANKIITQFNLKYYFSSNPNNHSSVSNFQDLIKKTKPNLVLNAIVGFAGLPITKYCLDKKIKLALANKESLVAAGGLIKNKKMIYPVDSEHSSLFFLKTTNEQQIKQIYIPASGGPFYNLSQDALKTKTYDEAIKHPIWPMGDKISIDSANLVNKCFEIIEAIHLFPNVKITALYHPQAIIHSMIEYQDYSTVAYLSNPDMKIAINLALNEFKIQSPVIKRLNFDNLALSFEAINLNKFVSLKWPEIIYENNLSVVGLVICVVDDYMINLFKLKKVNFLDIINTIDYFVNEYKSISLTQWNDIFKYQQEVLAKLNKMFA